MTTAFAWQVFRAVYSYPLLNQYLIDPAKPIRIQVANGHVTLYGRSTIRPKRMPPASRPIRFRAFSA